MTPEAEERLLTAGWEIRRKDGVGTLGLGDDIIINEWDEYDALYIQDAIDAAYRRGFEDGKRTGG